MKDATLEEKLDVIYEVSALTHGHPRSKLACGIYAFILTALMDTQNKEGIQAGLTAAKAHYETQFEYQTELTHYARIFQPDFANTPEEEIKSSGYVVDTLEAALWCVLTTDSYRDCVLKAVNLGSDTDTVAAVAGGLAGALYGYDSIPQEWRDALIKREWIEEMCERAGQTWGT
jgi:ADP-ribosylglycohydrolase